MALVAHCLAAARASAQALIYWTSPSENKIARITATGADMEDLFSAYSLGVAVDAEIGKIVWGDGADGVIRRADLDAGNVETLITATDSPWDIAIDESNGDIYWTDPGTYTIKRADRDGSNVMVLVSTGVDTPSRLALDVEGGDMYWTGSDSGTVFRSRLDGTGIEPVVATGSFVSAVAVDPDGGKLYWGFFTRGGMGRSNLDGSDVEAVPVTVSTNPIFDMALDRATRALYFVGWFGGGEESIYRFNVDDYSQSSIALPNGSRPYGLALGVGCLANESCVDEDVCTFDRCATTVCEHVSGVHGDVAGFGATCGPDGAVDIFDVFAVLDAFVDVYAEGCGAINYDLASSVDCQADDRVDVFDVFAVLDAFLGEGICCGG